MDNEYVPIAKEAFDVRWYQNPNGTYTADAIGPLPKVGPGSRGVIASETAATADEAKARVIKRLRESYLRSE